MNPAATIFWPDRVSMTAGAIAVLIGAGVLLGWTTGSELLISVNMRFIAMLPVTAVAILSCGVAIVLLQPRLTSARNVKIARTLAMVAVLIGAASFVSRIVDRDLFGLGLLFRESLTHFPYRPIGVMAINTAIVLVLTGTGLFLVASDRAGARALGRILVLCGMVIAGVALLGHLYGASALYAFDRFAGMALITAAGFLAVQVGALFLRAEDEGISLLTGPDLAAIVLRRMLPLAIVFPIVAGIVWITGREEEVFSRETGVALLSVAVAVWMLLLLVYNASFIRRADNERAALLESEHNARRVAESASKAKSDFLAVMSHELRTPLNAIIGYTGIMREGVEGPLSANQERNLRRISESAQHLVRLVNDILTLARVESGRSEARMELVVIPRLLEEVGTIIEPLARAKGLEFRCHADGSLTALTDAQLLRQILINLGGNAVKFTTKGSVAIEAARVGDAIRIDVRDTGIGIATSHFDKVFDEFWQVAPALTRSTGGAGLGLSVSRHLARQIGGEIAVSSVLDEGSVFSLSIPAHGA